MTREYNPGETQRQKALMNQTAIGRDVVIDPAVRELVRLMARRAAEHDYGRQIADMRRAHPKQQEERSAP